MSFMPSGVIAAAGAGFTMTMVRGGTDPGNVGYSSPAFFNFGSLTPDIFRGNTVVEFITNTTNNDFLFRMTPASIPNDDAAWRKITITQISGSGYGGPIVYLRADLAYIANIGGTTRWFEDNNLNQNFPAGTYTVVWE